MPQVTGCLLFRKLTEDFQFAAHCSVRTNKGLDTLASSYILDAAWPLPFHSEPPVEKETTGQKCKQTTTTTSIQANAPWPHPHWLSV